MMFAETSHNVRMPAATRPRTVSRGSGRRGEKKGKKNRKKEYRNGRKIARETRDLSTYFLFFPQVNSSPSLS
jgi:Ni/Co efflux regulator RcnB